MDNQRNLSLDILKIILSISVVFLHCHFLYDVSIRAYFVTVEGLFRLAVPIFLIISGFYFFNIKTTDQLKKWVNRLLILYIIWMLFYIYFWFDIKNPIKMIFTIINGYYILWYLVGALFSGLIVFFVKEKNTKLLIFLIILLFSIGCIIQLIGNLHIFSGGLEKILNFNPTHRNFLFVCFPFFMTGYLINKFSIYNKFNPNIFILLIALSLVTLESLLNYYFISKTESLDQLFSLLITAPIVFIFAKNKYKSGKTKELANLSTAIYLIHPLILMILTKYVLLSQTLMSIVVLIASFIASIFLVFLNKKFKYIL